MHGGAAGVKTQRCYVGCWFECMRFVLKHLLEINKAICQVLQQLTCRYNSSGRQCQPGHLSITHTSGCYNRTRRCWQRWWYGTTVWGGRFVRVNRKHKTQDTHTHTHTHTGLLFGFNLEGRALNLVSGLIHAKLHSRTIPGHYSLLYFTFSGCRTWD